MTQTFINVHLRDGRVLQFLPSERVTVRNWRGHNDRVYADEIAGHAAIRHHRRFLPIQFTRQITTNFLHPFRKPRRRRVAAL
jgi:hypothetical protein